MTEDKKVGYKNPPKETQFKKGQSGNPKGRPPGRKNFLTEIQDALDEKIMIQENGVKKFVTKKCALAKRIVNSALNNDSKATAQLTPFIKDLDRENPIYEQGLSDDDKIILKRYLDGITIWEHIKSDDES